MLPHQFSGSSSLLISVLLSLCFFCQPLSAVVNYVGDEVVITTDDWQLLAQQQLPDFSNSQINPDQFNWSSISPGFSGVSPGPVWLRLEIDVSAVPADVPMLYIPNAYLTNIQSVLIHNGEVLKRMDIGSELPLADKPIGTPFITVPLNIFETGRYTLLIHLDAVQVTQLLPYPSLLPKSLLLLHKLPQKLSWAAGVTGSLLTYIFFIVALLVYRFRINMLYALFFSLSVLLAVFCWEGLLFQFTGLHDVWWYQQFVISMVLCSIAMALLYLQNELQGKINSRWLHLILLSIAIVTLVAAGINLLEPVFFIPVIGPIIYSLLIFSLLLLIVILVYIAVVDGWRGKLMAITWLGFMIATLIRFMTTFYPSLYLSDMRWWGVASTTVTAWIFADYLWLIARDAVKQESLRSASESRIDLVNRLSHELRTPLNAVIGLADVLKITKDSKAVNRYAGMIHDSGQNLLGLVNDILDFSKAEKQHVELANKPIRLDSLLAEVHDGFLQQILNAGVLPVSFIDPSTPFFLRGDALRIKQILNNLVSNAIKFSDKGGTIEVRVAAEQPVDETVELLWQVKDDGRGIPLRLQGKIFEPYQQVEIGDAAELKGTGLGLAISRQLVEQMGGQISVESSPGQGSCFSFNLFLKLDDKAPDLDLMFADLKGKKLLMASRLKGVRNQLSANLRRWCPELIEEESIIDAIELAKTCDILITDTIHTLHAENIEQINALPPQVMLVVMTVETPAWLDDITGRKVRVLKLPAALLDVIAPVVEMLSGTPIALSTQVSSEQPQPVDLGHHHVLSVDDNPVNLTVVEKLLQSMGVAVVSEHSGSSALELLYKQHEAFSLVLLDCEMPGIDGFEMCRRLREFESRENLKPLPVIALTAHALSEIKGRCAAAGMDDTLFKPVSRETLAGLLAEY